MKNAFVFLFCRSHTVQRWSLPSPSAASCMGPSSWPCVLSPSLLLSRLLLMLCSVSALSRHLHPLRLSTHSLSAINTLSSLSPAPMSHHDLSAETLYILDGTAMMFQAHFSAQARSMTNPMSSSIISPQTTNSAETISFLPSGPQFKSSYLDRLSKDAPRIAEGLSSLSSPPLANALVTMVDNFARLVKDVKPRYVAVAFDSGRKDCFRRALFPLYKAQRPSVSAIVSTQR
jgi:hypothetical protein